ncbi:MAG: SDR family oxidoreductase [Silvanigrellaceae bacterium]|nr:SDR family oxidoreductase [Silvanigrellaceae bacterium]
MGHYLVIAASSTIGQEVVRELEVKGHSVFTTARDQSKIIPDIVLDASDFQAVEEVFEKAGSIDGVVNCSGSLLLRPAHLTSKQQFEGMINSCLTTAFATVRGAGKSMKQGGSVVLISSAAASIGLAHHDAVAAAKAGVNGLMLSAAATYAHLNLRFNTVSPGLVETHLTKDIVQNEAARKVSEGMHGLGRLGKPQDVARAIVFLLEPENNWITGQILCVDGGLSTLKLRPKL